MDVEIIEYAPALRHDFEALNREWLEAHFTVEPRDLVYFADPERTIVHTGGSIFFARIGNDIVGTCALIKDEGGLELAKMAVTASVRGRGIGERLVCAAIARAKSLGETRVRLTTNRSLTAAIALYRKVGFVEVPIAHAPVYRRTNVIMELRLDG